LASARRRAAGEFPDASGERSYITTNKNPMLKTTNDPTPVGTTHLACVRLLEAVRVA
jgi:hypothetical protein